MYLKKFAVTATAMLSAAALLAGCGDFYDVDIHTDSRNDGAVPEYEENYVPEYNYEPEYASVPLGSIYTIGSYPQTGRNDPIEWIVVECKDGDALLVSRYALDSVSYHSRSEDVTWETSSIRSWLNGTFYNAAFSSAEKKMILDSYCDGEGNHQYNINGGRETTDRVFMLSVSQANMYLPSDSERLCQPTPYAVKQGAYVNPNTGGCWWWLRNPGYTKHDAASVNSDGSIDLDDGSVNSPRGTVRPAIWIALPN